MSIIEEEDFWNDNPLLSAIPNINASNIQRSARKDQLDIQPILNSNRKFILINKEVNGIKVDNCGHGCRLKLKKYFGRKLSEENIRTVCKQYNRLLFSNQCSRAQSKEPLNAKCDQNNEPSTRSRDLFKNKLESRSKIQTKSNGISASSSLLKSTIKSSTIIHKPIDTLTNSLSKSKILSSDSTSKHNRLANSLKSDLLYQTKAVISNFMQSKKNQDLLKNSNLIHEALNGNYLLNNFLKNDC